MDSGHAEGGGSCRHEAAYYNGAKDYLPAVMPFIEEGLSAAEPVLALVPMPAAELLRERLNGQGRGLTFSDMGRLGRNPGRIISASSRPGTDATIAVCTSIGMLVDMPFKYTSWVSRPSGSRKIW